MNSWRPVSIALLLVVDTEGGTLEGSLAASSLLTHRPKVSRVMLEVRWYRVPGEQREQGRANSSRGRGEGREGRRRRSFITSKDTLDMCCVLILGTPSNIPFLLADRSNKSVAIE